MFKPFFTTPYIFILFLAITMISPASAGDIRIARSSSYSAQSGQKRKFSIASNAPVYIVISAKQIGSNMRPVILKKSSSYSIAHNMSCHTPKYGTGWTVYVTAYYNSNRYNQPSVSIVSSTPGSNLR